MILSNQARLYDIATPRLDCEEAPPDRPAHSHSPTSGVAVRRAKAAAPSVRRRLLEYLRDRNSAGATDDEMQDALDLAGDSPRPRRHELQKLGLIRDSGGRRPTRRGHSATVWIIAQDGEVCR